MQYYRKTSDSVYDLKYHLVWITKYPKPALAGEVGRRVRELIGQSCQELDIEIIKGHVGTDHVHIFVSIPPHVSVSWAMEQIKGRSSWKQLQEFPTIAKQYWGRHFWCRGYFAANSGNVSDA